MHLRKKISNREGKQLSNQWINKGERVSTESPLKFKISYTETKFASVP